MDCCCCTTASTEVHYKESPRYKRAAHAIDAENTNFFAQPGWSANLTEKQIVALFNYAVARQGSADIISYILREQMPTILAADRGFISILLSALMRRTDRICLEHILQYKPRDMDLSAIRIGFWKKSLLHASAECGNLPWLQYFVENLRFSEQAACWLDNMSTTPLYYAATNGHLDTTRYLVEKCNVAPTVKICKKATGLAREYLQKYNLMLYNTEAHPQATSSHMYQTAKPKRSSRDAALDKVDKNNNAETTPLLRKPKKEF